MSDREFPLDKLIFLASEYYQNLLGYHPLGIKLKELNSGEWSGFCRGFNLNENSKGIFLPRNQTAIVQTGIENSPLSLFHEYFGHGLYCEQSLAGKELVSLERKLLKEEQQQFKGRIFTLKDIQGFRRQNQTFQELNELKRKNLGIYEGFAIFTEFLLSEEFDLKEMFEKKYESLSKGDKKRIGDLISFNQQYGRLATFYTLGLARITTPERVKILLEDLYGKERIKQSRLILLTGSKKPFSDIDLFASSDYLKSVKNEWLDLVALDEKDFERRVSLFEIQVTHPIFAGEYIIGDRHYLEEKRRQLQKQPITEEAIQHNRRLAIEQMELAEHYPKDSKERQIGLSYSQVYSANALALKEGKRIFTKEELLCSQSENIKMKGGLE